MHYCTCVPALQKSPDFHHFHHGTLGFQEMHCCTLQPFEYVNNILFHFNKGGVACFPCCVISEQSVVIKVLLLWQGPNLSSIS